MNIFKKLFGKKTQKVATDPESIPESFKQQALIFDEIGGETISCTPENWTNAVLAITCDGRRIDYSLKNHRGEDGKASLSPRLAQLAENLYSSMASNGDQWNRAELRYDQDDEGWAFDSEFTYDREK